MIPRFCAHGPTHALTGSIYGQSNSFGGITNTFIYNNRLQPCRMAASSAGAIPTNCINSWGNVLDLSYDFHLGNGDNGNVYAITNYRDQARNQTFTYDSLNRLLSAQNAGTDCAVPVLNGKTKFWGNTYTYDAWGNLLVKHPTKCTAENLSVTAGTSNQLQAPYAYDAAGNLTHDATANLDYVYDPENRNMGTGGFNYVYDADGNRVEKTNGTTGTMYWYMSMGIVGESDLSGNLQSEYIFFDGERVARKDFPSKTVSYYFSDHLKTASVITDAAGNIKSESDYYPWGGELQFTNNDSNHYKFTGKERDSETGLDYFGARYYSNSLGRWISADWSAIPVPVPYGQLGDPQSLNLNAYVRDNPVSSRDADGHSCGMFGGFCITGSFADRLKDAAIGGGKALVNAVTSTINFATSFPNGIYVPSSGTNIPQLAPNNLVQKGAMAATNAVTIAAPFVPAARAAAATQVIVDMTYAIKAPSVIAQDALNAAAAARTGNPGALIGAYDASSGATAVGTSGNLSRLGSINPQLADLAEQQLGGVGAVTPGVSAPVGCCAEFDAANQLMNAGSKLSDINFTPAIRPSTGAVVPKCTNCGIMFPE